MDAPLKRQLILEGDHIGICQFRWEDEASFRLVSEGVRYLMEQSPKALGRLRSLEYIPALRIFEGYGLIHICCQKTKSMSYASGSFDRFAPAASMATLWRRRQQRARVTGLRNVKSSRTG